MSLNGLWRRVRRTLGRGDGEDTATWPNSCDSIGDFVDYSRDKDGNIRFTVWHAVGPARDEWDTFRDELIRYVNDQDQAMGQGFWGDLSVVFYMIGKTKETASPQVLFRSSDRASRRRARQAAVNSGIMDNHPLIKLGDAGGSFQLSAATDVEINPDTTLYRGPRLDVLTPALAQDRTQAADEPLGRRLFIQGQHSSRYRLATGSPVIRVGARNVQLTAGHAFHDSPAPLPPEFAPKPSTFDDIDFEGMSHEEEAHEFPTNRDGVLSFHNGHETALNASFASKGVRRWWRELGDITLSLRGGQQPRTQESASPTPDNGNLEQAAVDDSRNRSFEDLPESVQIGHLLHMPETKGLDYALIELEEHHRKGYNRIALGKNANQRYLHITTAWEITQDVPVVTSTSSKGHRSGKLIATASYLRYPSTGQFHEVFPVMLEGGVVQGDCGSPVVDGLQGYFYGHIVAGTPEAGVAYIVPATKVIADIKATFHQKEVYFTPQRPVRQREDRGRLARAWHATISPQSWALPRYELNAPVQFVDLGSTRYFVENPPDLIPEFGSSGYFLELEAMARYMKISGSGPGSVAADTAWPSAPHPSAADIADIENAIRRADTETRSSAQAESSRLPRRPRSGSRFSSPDNRGNPPSTLTTTSTSVFQNAFAALPLELQQHVLGFLPVPDLLNLRLVSRAWNAFITMQDGPIAFAHLHQSHIPTFALSLFPASTTRNMGYIAQLHHRYVTATRLSAALSDWITRDQFLRRKPSERAAFSESERLLRKRLVPLLLIAQHYLESYTRLLLDPATMDSEHEALERRIMAEYDDITLLQVHQFFPILMAYQARRLRPPSYLGHLERPIRGYRSGAVPEAEQIAMLYLGGLREVWRLTGIQPYEKLRRATDSWYAEIKRTPEIAITAENSGISGKGKLMMLPTSLEVGPPVPKMSRAETEKILGRLPRTKSQIWTVTAKKMLLERRVVARSQDIKQNAAVLQDLVLPSVSWLDVFFYERGADGVFDFGASV